MTTTNAYKQNRPVDAFTSSSINWKKIVLNLEKKFFNKN